MLDAELEATVVAAGFIGFAITWRGEVFSGAPQASSAASFGTLGITFRARKPRDQQEWLNAVSDAKGCAVAPTHHAAES